MQKVFVLAVFLAATTAVSTTAVSAQANGRGGINDFCKGVIDNIDQDLEQLVRSQGQDNRARGIYIRQLRQQLEGRENRCRRFLVVRDDDVSPHVGQNPGNNRRVGNAPYGGSRGRMPSGRGS